MNKTLIALLAALAFSGIATAANAQNVSVEAPRQFPAAPDVPVNPVIREAPELDAGFYSPLVLEYKLKSHSKAMGFKYGAITAAAKKCNIEGDYFSESDLADMLAGHSPDSAVAAMMNAYQDGLKAATPSCDKIDPYLNRMFAQVARHSDVIKNLNDDVAKMLIEAQRRHDEKQKVD